MADGVHPAVHDVQPPRRDSPIDGVLTESDPAQLCSRRDAVLRGGKRGDQQVDGAFAAHIPR
jgi:hypothetical protein